MSRLYRVICKQPGFALIRLLPAVAAQPARLKRLLAVAGSIITLMAVTSLALLSFSLIFLAINSPDLVNPFHSGRYWFHTADWLAKL